MTKGISGVSVPRKATDKYSTVMPTLNTAAPTITAMRGWAGDEHVVANGGSHDL
jgi:hypothetical protein